MDKDTNIFVRFVLRSGMTQEEAINFINLIYLLNKGKLFGTLKKAILIENHEYAQFINHAMEQMKEFYEGENSPLIKPIEVFMPKEQLKDDD